jgi:hypothetical protein
MHGKASMVCRVAAPDGGGGGAVPTMKEIGWS